MGVNVLGRCDPVITWFNKCVTLPGTQWLFKIKLLQRIFHQHAWPVHYLYTSQSTRHYLQNYIQYINIVFHATVEWKDICKAECSYGQQIAIIDLLFSSIWTLTLIILNGFILLCLATSEPDRSMNYYYFAKHLEIHVH